MGVGRGRRRAGVPVCLLGGSVWSWAGLWSLSAAFGTLTMCFFGWFIYFYVFMEFIRVTLVKLLRFQAYNSVTHHLCITLTVLCNQHLCLVPEHFTPK